MREVLLPIKAGGSRMIGENDALPEREENLQYFDVKELANGSGIYSAPPPRDGVCLIYDEREFSLSVVDVRGNFPYRLLSIRFERRIDGEDS